MQKGDKVIFKGASDEQISWGGNDDPRKYMKIGDTVTVKEIKEHSFHTKIYVEEYPDKKFNQISFEQSRLPGSYSLIANW